MYTRGVRKVILDLDNKAVSLINLYGRTRVHA